LASIFLIAVLTVPGLLDARERQWKTGVWADVRASRPKFVFGGASGGPAKSGAPRTQAITEIRTYAIDAGDIRIELKETTTADMPPLGAVVGEQVVYALEKDTLYVRDARGREHPLHVTKRAPRAQ